jgi:hypothetical protein
MRLNHDIHLGYCTNIHRGESWEETWRGLKDHTLRVKDRVSGGKPYGIGLRLSAQAANELNQPGKLDEFRRWLDANGCYVFTINGFPYGSFHGTRVKEQVFKPDWSTQERLDYTNLLFDLLAKLLPEGVSGSVSTLPGSHKTFRVGSEELVGHFQRICVLCREHIEKVAEASGHDLHLGLEPEPLGLFETSGETLKFFGLYLDQNPQDRDFFKFVGLNYDTCHLAIEFEEAAEALNRITGAGIRLSKLHFSSALEAPAHRREHRATPQLRRAGLFPSGDRQLRPRRAAAPLQRPAGCARLCRDPSECSRPRVARAFPHPHPCTARRWL